MTVSVETLLRKSLVAFLGTVATLQPVDVRRDMYSLSDLSADRIPSTVESDVDKCGR